MLSHRGNIIRKHPPVLPFTFMHCQLQRVLHVSMSNKNTRTCRCVYAGVLLSTKWVFYCRSAHAQLPKVSWGLGKVNTHQLGLIYFSVPQQLRAETCMLCLSHAAQRYASFCTSYLLTHMIMIIIVAEFHGDKTSRVANQTRHRIPKIKYS